jgi:5-methylcytosine-specific restriction endonuclease McrA
MSLAVKTCTGCKESKTLDCYGKKAASKDGLQSRCKLCIKLYSDKFRANNPEKVKESTRKFYAANKKKIAEKGKKYRLENREKEIERCRKYRKENPEKRRIAVKNWQQNNAEKTKIDSKLWQLANPEKVRYYANLRRSRKVTNGIYEISDKEIKRLYESPCFYCGSNQRIQLDHVIPISKGGHHSIGNLVPACQKCNASKHNKFLTEWKASLKWVI